MTDQQPPNLNTGGPDGPPSSTPDPFQSPGAAPYYRAPQYANAGPWVPAPPTLRPALSASVTLGAAGAVLVIMALGLAIAVVSGSAGSSVLVASAGLCVVIVAAVLAYAALKGLRAGWFIAASAIGAFLLVPVVALGGYATGQAYVQQASDFQEVFVETLEYQEVKDSLFTETLLASNPLGINTYDWQDTQISVYGKPAIVDLTGAPPDAEWMNIPLFAEGATVYVLLNSDQLPGIYGQTTNSDIVATRWTEPSQQVRTEFTGWLDSSSQTALLGDFWGQVDMAFETGPVIEITANESTVLFIQVADNSLRDPLPASSQNETAQSGAQSGGLDKDAQSGAQEPAAKDEEN